MYEEDNIKVRPLFAFEEHVQKAVNKAKHDMEINSNITLDENLLITVNKRIIRIEYPGVVKNEENAIATLGGMHDIELVVTDSKNRLEVHFHPENKYSKGVVADRHYNCGILLKITEKEQASENGDIYNYEVMGVTAMNFTFSKPCDFQYLPLVAKNQETKNSEVEYIYDQIFPKEIPSLDWFSCKKCKEQSPFFIPANFTRYDVNQKKLYLNTAEKYENNLRPDVAFALLQSGKQRKKSLPTRQISVFINLTKPNVEVPDKAPNYIMELIKHRHFEDKYAAVKELFNKRPIWTKVAIQHKTGITLEQAKIILPAIGYFSHIGPWRMTWIRYGYNPQKDSGSRIYQTLDYRIRAAEGTKLKVNAKRNYSSKSYFYLAPNLEKVSLKDKIHTIKKGGEIEERSYVLTPNVIPPARQMFYQYCDILLPEIQEMLSRLPKVRPDTKFDPKNGWLPFNFTEQCREIANRSVLRRVQQELLEDTRRQQEKKDRIIEKPEEKESPLTYCSKMLSNIKKGIYKSVNIDTSLLAPSTSKNEDANTDAGDVIELLDDDVELEQMNANDVIASMPETLPENSDDEENSDLEIDMEAVEEVNKMIDEVKIVTSFLKKTMDDE